MRNYDRINALPPAGIERKRVHIIGGGLAGLAAAVFLVDDAHMPGNRVTVYESLDVLGGALDAGGEEPLALFPDVREAQSERRGAASSRPRRQRMKNQAALEARHQEIEEAIDRPTPGTLTGHADATTPPQTLRAAAAQLVEERLQ